MTKQRSIKLASLVSLILVAGCSTGDELGSFGKVRAEIQSRAKHQVIWQRDAATKTKADYLARQIIAERLSADNAIHLAFLRNPAVQASLADIGIAEADVAQAGRLANPIVSIERIVGAGVLEIERTVLFSLMSLFTIGSRSAIARDKAAKARYDASLSIMKIAGDVERSWVEAVAAVERVGLMMRIAESAKLAEQLGNRMSRAGSMKKIDLAKIKVFRAETAGQLAKLRIAARISREKLIRAMGIWGSDLRFRLPKKLPRLPKRPARSRVLERYALIRRLDIRAAHKEVDNLRKSLRLTQATSFINLLEIGGRWNTEKEEGEKTQFKGFEVEFAIPIFDPGDAKVDRAKWTYMRAVEALKSVAINARSEVREAYYSYRGGLDLAKHYQSKLVPLSRLISEQELLRYNGMLIGVFELLAATRQQAQAEMRALDAKRDFWLSEGQLRFALLTGNGGGMNLSGATEIAANDGAGGH
jgi:outer membrane protein TolC